MILYLYIIVSDCYMSRLYNYPAVVFELRAF